MIDWTKEEIASIYGSSLYVLDYNERRQDAHAENADRKAAVSEKETIETQKNTVEWKSRPKSSITLILSEAEYLVPELTAILKNLVLEADIDLKNIGFGKAPSLTGIDNFSTMPTAFGVVFGVTDISGSVAMPYTVSGKSVICLPALNTIKQHTDEKARVLAELIALGRLIKA